MAHFARIEDDIVREVIVVRNEDMLDADGVESEAVGKTFIASIGLAGEWVQTSYNGSFRGKYAGIGDTYDAANDVFKATELEGATDELPTV